MNPVATGQRLAMIVVPAGPAPGSRYTADFFLNLRVSMRVGTNGTPEIRCHATTAGCSRRLSDWTWAVMALSIDIPLFPFGGLFCLSQRRTRFEPREVAFLQAQYPIAVVQSAPRA